MGQNMSPAVLISPETKKALDKAKIALMSKPDTAFFTTILFSLKLVWENSDRNTTAATDGTSLYINSDFFMSLDPDERVFLLVHESLHVAFMHMLRLNDRIHQKWNIACDHYINLLLIDRGYKMPSVGLADKQYIGLNPDQVYKLLPDDCGAPSMPDLRAPTGELGNVESEIQDILVRAAIQSKANNDKEGTIPGDIQIFLNKLLNPKLPWQRILQKYIQNMSKNDYSFRKPNRRYFPEFHLPSAIGEKVINLAIAVDASGSVTDAEFLVFVSEIHGIMKMMTPDKITLIQFDSALKAVDEVESLRELSKVKFTGRGGTKIEPVLNWVNENKPQLLLVFSDGEFSFRGVETKIPVIWLIHNRKQFQAPFGKIIHYEH